MPIRTNMENHNMRTNRKNPRLSLIAPVSLVLLIWSNVSLGLGWTGFDIKGAPCTGNRQGFGPFDYTNATHRKKHLKVVEDYHFTREVEQLKRGKSGHVAGDLDYTLRAFPNHHRALYALYRYATIPSLKKRRPLPTAPECYFQRAIAFKPGDPIVHTLYGQYLLKKKRLNLARTEFVTALQIRPSYTSARYYLGITLFKQGEMAEAQKQANYVYKDGYKGQRLRKILEEAGYPVTQER